MGEADLSSALSSLDGAIKQLKSSKKPSLLQLQDISKTITQAVVMADALGIKTASTSMLQGADVPVEMENYKFHSGSIIETLEKLLGEFRAEKNRVDAEEVSRVKTYKTLMQEQTDIVKSKTAELGESQKAKSKASEDIASRSQELSTTSANLLDDLEYLDEVHSISAQKARRGTSARRYGLMRSQHSPLRSKLSKAPCRKRHQVQRVAWRRWACPFGWLMQ